MGISDADRIRELGHRAFVGGNGSLWEEIAALQLEFLKHEGLKPNHKLIDIACGSLRAGRMFMEYLDAGNYFGLDKEIDLIIHGVAEELGIGLFTEKRPVFVVSDAFEFNNFHCCPDYAIAQSLLTHLTAVDIYQCFSSFRKLVATDCSFYATFFESETSFDNPNLSDALDCFFYTRDEMNMLANLAGWRMQYIGEWGHPRQQHMIKMTPQ